jgi:FkbM family methyltransferase
LARGAETALTKKADQRDKLLDCLIEIENILQPSNSVNVREDFTGPIVDMLFEDGELLQRTVSDGLMFNFKYSSEISRDVPLACGCRLDQVWEPQTTKSVIALSKGRAGVLIGGAHIGDKSPLCSARACAERHVSLLRAVLGQPRTAAQQSEGKRHRKCESESGGTLVVRWREDRFGRRDLHASPQLANGSSRENHFVSSAVDSYVTENGIAKFDLLMLDIEGGEYDALQGADKVLSRPAAEAPAVICEIHRHCVDWTNGLRDTPLCKLLIDHGYDVFAIRDYQGNEAVEPAYVELIDIDSAVIDGRLHGFNLLAVKSRARLSPDAFRIVHGVSPKLLKHRDPKSTRP